MTRRTALRAGALGLGGVLLAGEGLAGRGHDRMRVPLRSAAGGCASATWVAARASRSTRGAARRSSTRPAPTTSTTRWCASIRTSRHRRAAAWTPNATATKYEIKLRPGVKWHDGSPFTADDVIWSMRQMGEPTKSVQHPLAPRTHPTRWCDKLHLPIDRIQGEMS